MVEHIRFTVIGEGESRILRLTANNEARAWLADIVRQEGQYAAYWEMSSISGQNGGWVRVDCGLAGWMSDADVWAEETFHDDDGNYVIHGQVFMDPLSALNPNQLDHLIRRGRADYEYAFTCEDQKQPPIDSPAYSAIQSFRYEELLNPNPPPFPGA